MIFNTYSRRKELEAKGDQPDIYTYDSAPPHFRYQICAAIVEGIGTFHVFNTNSFRAPPNANDMWVELDRICRKEIFSYLKYSNEKHQDNLAQRFLDYLCSVSDIKDFIDALEIGCLGLYATRDDNYQNTLQSRNAKTTATEAIEEINGRLEQHAIGYRIENGRVIKVDSTFSHKEIVKPVLLLLSAPIFNKANDEFMTSHRHYRSKEYKEVVTSSNRAFESMMKAICNTENWEFDKGANAAQLVTLIRSKGLFTHDFEKSFDSYVGMLKSGLPSVRNDAGAHGESLAALPVQSEIARFALNMTASNMLFIGDCYSMMNNR